ncbi:bifunctional methylenetetrahydrofolate dehydrogenase/methenyltetrahydrofolate cyclohydrolase FolD [Conexibacter sp. DBS9H8]|uniref:bifunctional methylenetetrahydrofolate dehydrogenase/methenyltetrahydrofolate cyclohydrolase FolD n=1 Tax=Conexibacter sp. DBS9H8 TaxID=2937801 RepID=UPI00200CA7F3|nr:bifunctional methylenetetrahydrofolate dehydrogenase/methenyltetrahydrofolate cyclohydrolase FolD [Conexibacter sp. DBS9H8]
MSAEIIDGKAIAAGLRATVAAEVETRRVAGAPTPGLATILVGEDPASEVYIGMKRRQCVEVGIADLHRHLPADTPQAEVAAVIAELNADPSVSGILLQLPVPKPLDGGALTELIHPDKDVDGLTAISVGRLWRGDPGLRPCTPSGVMAMLAHHAVPAAGARAVVVGRSDLVGKPLAALLQQANATVTMAHSRTRDLAAVTREADILVAAVGVPGLIGAGHVKPGAVVIDVGMNRLASGLVGDVDFPAVAKVAGLLTPVPGGVGPLTIAMLLSNTLAAATLQAGADASPH